MQTQQPPEPLCTLEKVQCFDAVILMLCESHVSLLESNEYRNVKSLFLPEVNTGDIVRGKTNPESFRQTRPYPAGEDLAAKTGYGLATRFIRGMESGEAIRGNAAKESSCC